MNIIIATITRNRPIMIRQLYKSIASLELPPGHCIDFLIIENNSTSTSFDWLNDIRSSLKNRTVTYLLETNIGISSARNRALEYALQNQSELLVFVDDDEQVAADWFLELLREQQRLDLDIVGSSVRPVPAKPNLNPWKKLIWSGIEANNLKAEKRARRKWNENKADTIKIATGSWLGRMEFFRRTGLRFDSRIGLAGGEDWNLWLQAKELGAKTGWAPDAIVYETVPDCRISLAYHFRRNRAHNATEFGAQYRKSPRRALLQFPTKLLSRIWKLFASICMLPFMGGQALISMAMALGAIVGLIGALFGISSKHYVNTTGF